MCKTIGCFFSAPEGFWKKDGRNAVYNTKETSGKSAAKPRPGVSFVLYTECSPGFFPKPLCRAEKKPDVGYNQHINRSSGEPPRAAKAPRL